MQKRLFKTSIGILTVVCLLATMILPAAITSLAETTPGETKTVDFLTWSSTSGTWDTLTSPSMEINDNITGFIFDYTMEMPNTTRKLELHLLDTAGDYYYKIYLNDNELSANIVEGTKTVSDKYIVSTNEDSVAISARLEMKGTTVNYYVGDMTTPLLTGTADAYAGGQLHFNTRRPDGIVYKNASLTYYYADADKAFFSEWEESLGTWDYLRSPLMDDKASGFAFKYTMEIPAMSNRNISLYAGAPKEGTVEVAPYDFYVQLSGNTLNLCVAGNEVVATAAAPAAYDASNACVIPACLEIRGNELKYYMGDMQTSLLTYTFETDYDGGCLGFASRRPDGIVYKNASLTYYYDDATAPANTLGAQVQKLSGKSNLRFGFEVACTGVKQDATTFEADYKNGYIAVGEASYKIAEVGALVCRKANLTDAETELVLNSANAKVSKVTADKLYEATESAIKYTVKVTNIPDTSCDTKLVARPYMAYYVNGALSYAYGTAVEKCVADFN